MGLLVVTGPPGSGKSSVAPLLARDSTPSALVAGDRFYEFLYRGGIDPWLPAAHAQNTAITVAAAAASGRLAEQLDVVYDGVLGPWLLTDFLAATGMPSLDYVVLLPDEGTCVRRVAARTGHGFTDPVAAGHMHREFAAAHIDARHVITDATGSVGDIAALIRHRRREGVLRYP